MHSYSKLSSSHPPFYLLSLLLSWVSFLKKLKDDACALYKYYWKSKVPFQCTITHAFPHYVLTIKRCSTTIFHCFTSLWWKYKLISYPRRNIVGFWPICQKIYFGHFSAQMAYHWIQKRCPGEKRAKVATDKSPKSTLGGITPNLRDETCRALNALNYVWKIGVTKEQQGKQHGTEIGNTFFAGSPLVSRHTSDNEHV